MTKDFLGRAKPVPAFVSEFISGDATNKEQAIFKPAVTAPSFEFGGVAVSRFPDLSPYDLTISEAFDLFSGEGRKRPSERSLQRYCQDGRFDCYKLKTTRNNGPVHEWIINSTSLLEFIHTKPIEEADDAIMPPTKNGGASSGSNTQITFKEQASAMTSPDKLGDASIEMASRENTHLHKTDIATPDLGGDAKPAPSKIELLIENAELTAKLDAKEELVSELREDKKFMREQIMLNRTDDKQIAKMHGQTLETLKAVSLAGRHTKIETAETPAVIEARFQASPSDEPEEPPHDGV